MLKLIKKTTFFFLLIFSVNSLTAQQKAKILLTDMDIQIDATAAVNHLYNFKFKEAKKEFNWIKYRYPNHPMPYFLIGFTYWWRMQPDIENIKKYDKKFISYMDSTITMAEKIYDEDEENIDAIFFLSSAYGFLARIYGERGNYTKAILPSKRALNFVEEGKKYSEFSSEFFIWGRSIQLLRTLLKRELWLFETRIILF